MTAALRAFLFECAKDGMTLRQASEQFGISYQAARKVAGGLFAQQRSERLEAALAKAVAAYKDGVPATTAARTHGLDTRTLLAELAELGIKYERRHTGPVSGPRFASPEDVMSEERGAGYKRVRDLLLAGKTRSEAAKAAGVSRTAAGVVASHLIRAGKPVTTASACRRDAMREAAAGGTRTLAEIAEIVGISYQSVCAMVDRMRQDGEVLAIRKAPGKHAHARAFVAANPTMGPAQIAKALGVSYFVAARARGAAIKAGTLTRLCKHDNYAHIRSFAVANPTMGPAQIAKALGVSYRVAAAARIKAIKDGLLQRYVHPAAPIRRAVEAHIIANPRERPRSAATRLAVSVYLVYESRARLRKLGVLNC